MMLASFSPSRTRLFPDFDGRLLIILLVIALEHGSASAAVYYVSAGHAGGTGTEDQPWSTVQEAADIAAADDTVLIEDGNYPENVVVKHSGLPGHPITFRARHNRGAMLQAIVSRSESGGFKGLWPCYWITLQGIRFSSPASNGSDHGVYPSTGWDFEDCTFEGHTEVGMHGDMVPNLDNITVRHCLFQDCYATSFGGYGGFKTPTDLLHDVLVQDCIVRRSNLSNTTNTGWDGGVNKFLYSKDITLDGIIAYDNNGCSIWFDTDNQNFKVINCTVFGNHSGWFYNATNFENSNNLANGGKALWDNTACSFAVDTEANPGPGLIDHNVLYSNVGGRGVVQACSGNGYGVTGDHRITITHNIFADNQYQLYFWSQDGPENTRGPRDTLIADNTFYGWGFLLAQGGGTTDGPGGYHIIMSHNIYDPGQDFQGEWGEWAYYKGASAKSLDEMQSVVHLEDGTSIKKPLSAFPGQLPPGTITNTPGKEQVEANGAARATPAMSEITTPASSTDAQLTSLPSNQAISAPVTITVFGHTPLVATGVGEFDCEVYDLQGRWVSLTVSAAGRPEFEQRVLPYATLTGRDIVIRVTRKSPYQVTAQFLAQSRER